jgi:hypothetical protein
MISIVSLMLARIWSSSKIGPTPLHKSVIPMIPRSANGANSGVLGCQEGHGCQLVSAGFKNRVSSIGIAPLLCPTKRSMLFLLSYFRVITTVLLAIIPGVPPSTALKFSYTRMNLFTVSIRDAVPHSNVPLSKGTLLSCPFRSETRKYHCARSSSRMELDWVLHVGFSLCFYRVHH